MKLEILYLWSPDLVPPSIGVPTDIEDFEIFVQVSIGEVGKPGEEVFGFTVISPSMLAVYESGRFVTHTLVLTTFSWESITNRIEKLFSFASSANDWDEVIECFKGLIEYAD